MARTKNSQEVRAAFAARLGEELDRVGYPITGRASSLARDIGVTHTTTGSWLHGSMPAVGVLVDICKKLGLDFTYLCTGERSIDDSAPALDADLFRYAVHEVNEQIKKNAWMEDIGLDRLGTLYMRAYISMREKASRDQIKEDVRLAAGR